MQPVSTTFVQNMVNISPEALGAFSRVLTGLNLNQFPSLTTGNKKDVIADFIQTMKTNEAEHLGQLKDAKIEDMEKEYVKAGIFLYARVLEFGPTSASADSIRVSDTLRLTLEQRDTLCRREFLGTDDKSAKASPTFCSMTLPCHVPAIRKDAKKYNEKIAEQAESLIRFKQNLLLELVAFGERINRQRAVLSMETKKQNEEEASLREQQQAILLGAGVDREVKEKRKKRKREKAAAAAAGGAAGGGAGAAGGGAGDDSDVEVIDKPGKKAKKDKKDKGPLVSPPGLHPGLTQAELFGAGPGAGGSAGAPTDDDMFGAIMKALDGSANNQSPTKTGFQQTKAKELLLAFPDLDALVIDGYITTTHKDKMADEDVDMKFLVRAFLGPSAPNGQTAFTSTMSSAGIKAGTASAIYDGLFRAYQTL